jgi:hypothetical protein
MASSSTSAAQDDLSSFLDASSGTDFEPTPEHVLEAFLRLSFLKTLSVAKYEPR